MKYLTWTFLLTCIIVFTSCQSKDIDSVLFRQFNSDELIADLEFIKERVIAKKYNRTPYLFFSQDRFDHQYDSIKQVILKQGRMSLTDFYMLVTPFANSICDDHLSFPLFGLWGMDNRRPKEFDNHILWPVSAIIHNDDIYVTCSNDIPENSRLVSINNISSSKIVEQLIKYSPYFRQRYYDSYGVLPINLDDYSLLLYTLFDVKDSISVKYKPYNSDKTEELSFALAKFYEIDAVKRCRNINKLPDYELRFENNTAVLRLNTFSYRDFDKTILLYNQVFNSIKTKGAGNLIIDISQNGGGSDINWIILLNYLTDRPLQLNCDKPEFRVSEILQQLEVDQSHVDFKAMYKGNIYLIIGSETFSSAVRFADVMKSNGVCDKIFGQETLGQATHYGEVKTYFLPNTKLKINVSSKLFPSLNCGDSKTGVVPEQTIALRSIDDYINSSKNVYTIEQTLKLIE